MQERIALVQLVYLNPRDRSRAEKYFRRRDHPRNFCWHFSGNNIRPWKKASGAIRLEGKYFRLWNLWCHESSLKRPRGFRASRLRRQIFSRVYSREALLQRFATSILFITCLIHYVTMDSEGSGWYFIRQRKREIDHRRCRAGWGLDKYQRANI